MGKLITNDSAISRMHDAFFRLLKDGKEPVKFKLSGAAEWALRIEGTPFSQRIIPKISTLYGLPVEIDNTLGYGIGEVLTDDGDRSTFQTLDE